MAGILGVNLLAVFFLFLFIFFPFFPSSALGDGENREMFADSSVMSSRRELIMSPVESPEELNVYVQPDYSKVKAVGAAATGSLAAAGVFAFFFRKCSATKRRHKNKIDSAQRINIEELVMKQQGIIKTGTILDDDDDLDEVDLLYWRKLENGQLGRNFSKEMMVNPLREEVRPGFQQASAVAKQPAISPVVPINRAHVPPPPPPPPRPPPMLENGAMIQHFRAETEFPTTQSPPDIISTRYRQASPPPAAPQKYKPAPTSTPPAVPQKSSPSPPWVAPRPLPMSATSISQQLQAERKISTTQMLPQSIPLQNKEVPPSIPSVVPPKNKIQSLPSAITPKKIPDPPPPPPIPPRKTPAHTPSPPILAASRNRARPTFKVSGVKWNASLKPPQAPRRKSNSSIDMDSNIDKQIEARELKLKPLHWDKVVANTDHSMVWDEINSGSFGFDDELMVSLFGFPTSKEKASGNSNIAGSKSANSPKPAQISILDPRKSQNIAIVLKSLAVSRKEILDALLNGEGLTGDQLEKLSTISPTQEETARILHFDGNPTKLATAESFLYHILKALPSAFTRVNAMLFRSIYDPEILHQKESLQTLELGCKELRSSAIFVRLLEAILKAGNKLNAGTARGNAQGFHLTALTKLSEVRSTNGKITLLQFVIEQVVRSEGRRCAVNQNHVLGRSGSQRSKDGDPIPESQQSKDEIDDEKDMEYMRLGLPILGGLSGELSHVKKAAAIEHDSFISVCPSLANRVTEIKRTVTSCNGEKGGFVQEMKGLLEACEEELKVVGEEQTRVLELVKRTTDYYQAGASKEKGVNPFQLFRIIKDFLDMVDQVCMDITQRSQKKTIRPSANRIPPTSPTIINLMRFPNIQPHFFQHPPKNSSSSDSEEDF